MYFTKKIALFARLCGLSALVGLAAPACDGAQTTDREGVADDDEGGDASEVCHVAEALDDACEAVFGEEAEECAPFDAADEACEHHKAGPACALAEALDDACEALYGEDDEACAAADALDEACDDGEDEDEA